MKTNKSLKALFWGIVLAIGTSAMVGASTTTNLEVTERITHNQPDTYTWLKGIALGTLEGSACAVGSTWLGKKVFEGLFAGIFGENSINLPAGILAGQLLTLGTGQLVNYLGAVKSYDSLQHHRSQSRAYANLLLTYWLAKSKAFDEDQLISSEWPSTLKNLSVRLACGLYNCSVEKACDLKDFSVRKVYDFKDWGIEKVYNIAQKIIDRRPPTTYVKTS